MASFLSQRRYCLQKRIVAKLIGDDAISALWQSKQEAEPGGTVFPATFPAKEKLNAVGYVAKEDLVGADTDELTDYAALSRREADAAIAAAAAL
jgi:hypothetical protein